MSTFDIRTITLPTQAQDGVGSRRKAHSKRRPFFFLQGHGFERTHYGVGLVRDIRRRYRRRRCDGSPRGAENASSFAPLYTQMISFCLDWLGTNTGNVEKRRLCRRPPGCRRSILSTIGTFSLARPGKNTRIFFCLPFRCDVKMIILPRQARDKCGWNTVNKSPVAFVTASARVARFPSAAAPPRRTKTLSARRTATSRPS